MLPSPDESKYFVGHMVDFVRLLRKSGIPVYPGATIELCRGLEYVDLASVNDFHYATRTSLVYRCEDLSKFDALFNAYWRNKELFLLDSEPENLLIPDGKSQQANTCPDEAQDDTTAPLFTYSDAENLSTKDLGDLTDAEIEQARRQVRQFVSAFASRKSRRQHKSHRGRLLDFRRLLRRTAAHDVIELCYRRPKIKKLRLMLLCDVSGSMERYSRFLLQFIFALRRELPTTDAAVFATRLTPIADLLGMACITDSLSEVAKRAQDWGGGTNIGGSLREFNDHYANRMVRADSVVAILSDGWDRGDATVMRDQIKRLRRRAHKIIWLNPLMGNPEYQPLTQGMRTALPHLDYFLPAHNLESLARLARTLRRIWR